MDSLTVDNTYGQAMYEAARSKDLQIEILKELLAVSAVFKENPKLQKLFLLPTVSVADKRSVCRDVFGGRVSGLVQNFLMVLIDKNRIGAWSGIVNSYEKLFGNEEGFTRGILYSVVPIEGKTLQELERKTGLVLGKYVKLINHIDTTLIGGVRIYIDGMLIDASVKKRLENMKQAMLGLKQE